LPAVIRGVPLSQNAASWHSTPSPLPARWPIPWPWATQTALRRTRKWTPRRGATRSPLGQVF